MLQHLHQVSNKVCIRHNMKALNFHIMTNTNLFLTPDKDVVTSKISPVNLFTLLH